MGPAGPAPQRPAGDARPDRHPSPPRRGPGGAHDEGTLALGGPAQEEAEADAGGVERAGGEQEAQAIGSTGGGLRHLRAVRVAVEDREQADDGHGECGRRLDAKRHDGTQHDHRQGDAGLDEGHADAGDAEGTTERHHADEGGGHQPQSAAAELEGEHADHHHRQHMVEAGDRVGEAVHEAGRVANASVGEGDRRHEGRECGEGEDRRGVSCHE